MTLDRSRQKAAGQRRARLWLVAIALVIGCSDNGPSSGPVVRASAHAPDAAAAPPLGTTGGPTANTLQPSEPPPLNASLAPGVRIREIAVFQGTKTPIAKDGQRVPTQSRKLPVIAGRDALVRVYVDAAAQSRPLTGELYIERGGALQVVRETTTIAGPSRDEDRDSTFDFELPGAIVQPDAHYLVRVIDPAAPSVPTTASNPAQYPPMRALETFEAQQTPKLRIMIVPTQYAADGSNRMPDLSPPMLEKLRKRMLEFYPVPEVELTMHQPIKWTKPLRGDAAGWDEFMMAVIQLRLSENAPFDVYYYAAVAPAPSPDAFCTGGPATGCIGGVAPMGSGPADVGGRIAAGLVYDTQGDIDTMPHELGHAHGQDHAPCGSPGSSDPNYPYAGGVIGVWGYSVVTKELKPPSLADQMGYCPNLWQSDYVYGAFFRRARLLAGMRVIPGKPRNYRMVKVAQDGTFEWTGEAFTSNATLDGVAQPIQWVDDAGQVVGSDEAHGYRFHELPGGYMIVPVDSVPHATHVRFDISQRMSDALMPLRQHVGRRVQLRR